jgi:outer membrane protein assembly factor BamB
MKLIGLAILVLLSACASSTLEREEPSALPDFKSEATLQEIWSTQVSSRFSKEGFDLHPDLSGGAIFASDHFGHVAAFDADSGQARWRVSLPRSVTSAVGVGEGTVVVGTNKGDVLALDQETGQTRWQTKVSSEILAPAAIAGDLVAVQTIDGKLVGLSRSNGKKLWEHGRTEPALSLHGTSRPLIVGEQVFTGFGTGKIVAVGRRDGKLLWEFTVAQPRGRNEIERLVDVDAPVLIAGNALYAVSFQGKLVAVDLSTGRSAWTRDLSSVTRLDADRAQLYVADDKGQVLALDLRTGASLWKQDKLRARFLNGPRVHGDYVVVGDFEGYVHFLARDDGRFVARLRVGEKAIRASVLALQDRFFVSNEDGTLAALRLSRP